MAITVKFGISNKKRNSTLQPTPSLGLGCTLKSGTSVENPTFELQYKVNWKWNYCYCEDFGRYYFINDITYKESVYYISCTCDYLASYKTEILKASPYVVRSASFQNPYISDMLFPCDCNFSVQQVVSDDFEFSNSGSIIVETAGESGSAFHACSPAQYSALCNYLYSSTFLDALTDITKVGDIITKQVFHTSDYLIGATWMPINIGGGGDDISLGYISGCGTGTAISQGKIWGSVVTIAVPHHPDFIVGQKGFTYRDYAPFASYSISIPYIGTVVIPPDFLSKDRNITVGLTCDVAGNVQCQIFNSTGLLCTMGGCFGVTVGYSTRSQTGLTNLIKGGTEFVTGIATGNFLGIGKGVYNVVTGSTSADISSTSSGGCSVLDKCATLTCTFKRQDQIDYVNNGYPVCQSKTLSTLSGYTLCENASIECGATSQGKATINDFLNGGFYIE